MAEKGKRPAVALFRYEHHTDQMVRIAVFSLTDDGRKAVCKGEGRIYRNLVKNGLWVKDQGQIYPRDGMTFLRAVRGMFNTSYLRAQWLL